MSQPSCSHSNTIYEIQLQKTIVLRMQPKQEATLTQRLQCDLQRWVAKHNRTTRNGVGNCSSKTGWISTPERKKDDFEALFKTIFRRKITSAKMEKICWQITVAAFMQPLQSDLRDPAAKDNSITNAATARSNLDAAIYTAGTILQLQSTMEFHRQLIHQHHLQSHLQCGNDPRVANHNGIPSATHPPAPLATPFTMRERSYSCKSQWNSVDRKCTKSSWNPIYNAEPIRPYPTMIRPHTRPSRTRRTAEVDHPGSGTNFVWKNIVFKKNHGLLQRGCLQW